MHAIIIFMKMAWSTAEEIVGYIHGIQFSLAGPHKVLKSPIRFTNLPLGSMSPILKLMGLMYSYRTPGVPRTPRSCNALIHMRCGNPYQIWPPSITITSRLRFVNLFVEGSRVSVGRLDSQTNLRLCNIIFVILTCLRLTKNFGDEKFSWLSSKIKVANFDHDFGSWS